MKKTTVPDQTYAGAILAARLADSVSPLGCYATDGTLSLCASLAGKRVEKPQADSIYCKPSCVALVAPVLLPELSHSPMATWAWAQVINQTAFLLLVVRPGAPSSILVTGKVYSKFLASHLDVAKEWNRATKRRPGLVVGLGDRHPCGNLHTLEAALDSSQVSVVKHRIA